MIPIRNVFRGRLVRSSGRGLAASGLRVLCELLKAIRNKYVPVELLGFVACAPDMVPYRKARSIWWFVSQTAFASPPTSRSVATDLDDRGVRCPGTTPPPAKLSRRRLQVA